MSKQVTTKTKNEILDLSLELASAIARMQEPVEGASTATRTPVTAPKRTTNGLRIQAVLTRLTKMSVPEIVSRISIATGRSKINARSLISYDAPTFETVDTLAKSLNLSVGRLANALSQAMADDPLPGWGQAKKLGLHRADMGV
jgi:hypothetical protein